MHAPQIDRSALLIVDMQNGFVHPDGEFAQRARNRPNANIDMPFLQSVIPHVKGLAEAFRKAGRPVIHIAHVVKADYSDAQWPWWRLGHHPGSVNSFNAEGSWGARIIDELAPMPGEHLVIKKGFNGFINTPLDSILRNLGVTTCVVSGVTTSVCVSTTVRGGVELNYRMMVASDAVAEITRAAHDAELKTLSRAFADVKTTDEVAAMLSGAGDLRR